MAADHSNNSMIASLSLTDEQLWLKWQQGDRTALETILVRYEDRLVRIAYRITGCRHESEDIRHTVLVRFLQSTREVRHVEAWLTRCTLNEAINRARQKGRESRALATLGQSSPVLDVSSPLQQLQYDEVGDKLGSALAQLTPDDRALLTLRFDEDLTFRQIADVLEKPQSTVKSQLTSVISRLRALLGME